MEDSSDLKSDETLNLEGTDQIKEAIVEVVESSNGIHDDSSSENIISIKEEESGDKILEAVDLENLVEIIDVSESLTDQIGELETLVENSDIKPESMDNVVESDSLPLVETDNVAENESKETEELVVHSLVESIEASPGSTDILEKGLEASTMFHESDNGDFDANKEVLDPLDIEQEGNVDDALDKAGEVKTAESTENKPEIVISESKICWRSWLGCCGLLEALHLSGR